MWGFKLIHVDKRGLSYVIMDPVYNGPTTQQSAILAETGNGIWQGSNALSYTLIYQAVCDQSMCSEYLVCVLLL